MLLKIIETCVDKCDADSTEMPKRPFVIAIDGRAASGKSTLAEQLSTLLEADVIHMDDFFLQPYQRTPERLAEIGGNVDYERFAKEGYSVFIGSRTLESAEKAAEAAGKGGSKSHHSPGSTATNRSG